VGAERHDDILTEVTLLPIAEDDPEGRAGGIAR
jgi:hypothetical protein